MAATFLALGLLVLLAGVGLAFYWQGSIRLPGAPVAYGVEESIKYITPRLSDEARQDIGPRSVRRILEWEMKYVQDRLAADPENVVVFGGPAATAYVLEQTGRQGFDYPPAIVGEILDLQADYLASIGAIAAPVAADELEAIAEREERHG